MPTTAIDASKVTANVISGHVLEDPWFYVVFLSLTVAGSAIGGLLSAYFKKRGETLATKADFSALQDQLRESTRLAEEIKHDVQARYGEQASVRSALRERTESLVMATFELEDWFTHIENKVLGGEQAMVSGSPMAKIAAYRDIYFHEIDTQFSSLGNAYHAYVGWILEYQRLLLDLGAESQEAILHFETFREVYDSFVESLGPFRARVIEVARSRGGL